MLIARRGSAAASPDSVFDYLPDLDDPAEDEPEEPAADLPGVVYGMVGAVSGVVIGLLVSYLMAPYLSALAVSGGANLGP